MGRITQRKQVTRVYRDGQSSHTTAEGSAERFALRTKQDVLAAEEPLEIRLGGESFTVTMRTPGNDFELVAGFLVAEGMLSSAQDLHSMRYCAGTDELGNQTYNVIDCAVDPQRVQPVAGGRRHVLTTSACGICGTASIDAVEKTLPAASGRGPGLSITAETMLQLPDTLREHQKIFAKTGGVHAAGLFDAGGTLMCLREDVGRHNAVDKVVGWALLEDQLPLAGTVLQVSGRASFELVQKAALAGIEMLSAVGAPSSLAVDLAERAGLTLVGFSRGHSANIYTHSHRIKARLDWPSQEAVSAAPRPSPR
ncbi:formate dehydrogenase accessory sulfurtransferase FdhD [Nesterenkonia sphaerica]|uniref:Sulfur carrier protein FdhD n=1 Tax=Nesterenkonia sphaerica TaxID=1804988 RepID=A0A5R9AMP1_9MICC|nr:formate dehydrogenase accessory sulfurtransferase FdhD [Nesterenkonia sphaerica]TLP80050.1 formate dehydrogenase accessory sulfurtransferase FdhD [Nesterenkonia sphaerica]